MGHHAVLVEDPPGGPAAWSRGVRAHRLPGVVDIVPAARTVLVRWAGSEPHELLLGALRSVEPVDADPDTSEIVIPVRYDGPDLDAVAEASGLSPRR
jgi:allophanate hydrolase subunit 1